MTRPTLNELEAFAAVARHLSFQKAADALGLSRSALSHTVIGLERRLGVRLLNRTTRSVAPTDAGLRLLERLTPILRGLDAALDGLAEARGEPSGLLRINANKRAAQLLLGAVVPRFLARHPGWNWTSFRRDALWILSRRILMRGCGFTTRCPRT
ncbi:LysR family transcriptional regulator [Acidocella sp. MX-AZ03]|uniref:LysR family transcriptional regulator n=1 Tax=Acidocella sp. MX-AZ03 TaxID=2697363 RepID=UPI002FD85B29